MVQREVHYHLQHEPWKGNKCFSKKYQYGIEYILLMKMEYSRKVYQMNNGSKYEKGIEKTITKCIHQHIKNLTVFRLIIYTNEKSHSRYSIPLNARWNYPWKVDYFFKSVPKIKTTIIYKKPDIFTFRDFITFFTGTISKIYKKSGLRHISRNWGINWSLFIAEITLTHLGEKKWDLN